MFGTKSRIVRLTAALLALVCVSIGLTASPASALAAAAGETGTVTGRVVREDGGSVDQIDVSINGYRWGTSEMFSADVKTDSNGRYVAANVPLDMLISVFVQAQSDYLTTGTTNGSSPSIAGQTAEMSDVVLATGGAVKGTVSVSSEIPAGGKVIVCVSLVSSPEEEGTYLCSDSIQTNSEHAASYTIKAVPAGTYRAQLSGSRIEAEVNFVGDVVVSPESTTTGIDFSASFKPYTLKPVGPNRAIETRSGRADGAIKVAKAKVGPAKALDVKLAGVAGVPSANVAAASLVVTVTNPSAAGYVTVYPCGQRPTASNLNFAKGQTVANAVVAPLSGSGHVCFFASVNTDLIVDVNGYMTSGGGFVPRTPARLMETRPGRPADLANVSKTKVRPGATRRIDLTKISGLSDSVMLSLNVTATGSTGAGHVSVYPCATAGQTATTSTLNFAKGATVANAALVFSGSNGGFCVSSSTPVDVLIDMNGFFEPDSGISAGISDISGGRLYDTRPGRRSFLGDWLGNPGQIGGAKTLYVPEVMSGSSMYNVTVVAPAAAGYLTAYPCNDLRPATSNINFTKGKTVAGLVMSGNDGGVCIYSSTNVDLIVDGVAEVIS